MKFTDKGICLLLLLLTVQAFSQVTNNSVTLDWRQHNLNKYNRMLFNPAYSISREQGRALSFWSRIQWAGVNNAPQTFLLNYSGKIGENAGAGLGLYQQNLGLLTDSGLLMNYAYQVQFSEKVHLTLGLNSTLFRRGLNQTALSAADPDPAILENQNDFLWLFMPGMTLSAGKFDLGFYAENLFDYNLNESRSVTGFNGKIYSGHLAFNQRFVNAFGIMRDAVWRGVVYAKTQPNEVAQYGGNTMIDLPKYGWFQMGYNNTYGVNGVLGVKIGGGMSIALTYESGWKNGINNFGPTYEAMATIELGNSSPKPRTAAVVQDTQNASAVKEHDNEMSDVTMEEQVSEMEAIAQTLNTGYAVIGGAISDKDEQSNDTTTSVATAAIPDPDMNRALTQNEEEMKQALLDKVLTDIDNEDVLVESSDSHETTTDHNEDLKNKHQEHRDMAQYLGLLASLEDVPEDYEKQTYLEGEEEAISPEGEKNENENEKSSSYRVLNAGEGVKKGFYLVVNVFAEDRYFKEFTEDLRSRGLEPLHFLNPDNNYQYVYLAYADNYYRAKQLQRSHFNGKYREEKWVLWVK
ncbi:type IX secretion system membrane protein PorP/SprF [Robertkochia marina]|uniref:Type IX secretion system membrane protein PorP/SprF n=1 Tax=Robertkochia marina TaxID=1227945 RepID=A0A4S3M1A4_9FLAO|nr:PorP/SprF family type IX secretion system membrane protein [Robertkochia marina]THD67803.1 type IX secretion system membrane protein PorP/SprF [Robertkochia marina]TRZ41723.1 type IX secretion system membrane protein PorP/SprF [Robertkochia marina]